MASRRERVFSRREVEALIAEGRSIIVMNGKVLKVDAWLKYHPGGDKAIMHMVGRDATDEVTAYVILSCQLTETELFLILYTVCTLPKLSSACTPTRLALQKAAGPTSFPQFKVDNSV